MAQFADEKTHDPTPRRRAMAREAGRVAHSQDLSSAVLLLGSLLLLLWSGGGLIEFLADCLRGSLGSNSWRSWSMSADASNQFVASQLSALVSPLARVLLPLLAGAVLLAVMPSLLQTGFLFRPGRIAPDPARINPLAGLARVFSGASAARLFFGVFKIAVVATIAVVELWSRREQLASLVSHDVPGMFALASDICLGACLKIGIALLALAALDYLFARLRLERELKMTPEEIREEMRQLEGNPQIAARRRESRRVVRAADSERVSAMP